MLISRLGSSRRLFCAGDEDLLASTDSLVASSLPAPARWETKRGRTTRRSKVEFILCRPPPRGPCKFFQTGKESQKMMQTARTSRVKVQELGAGAAALARSTVCARDCAMASGSSPTKVASSKHHKPGMMVNQFRKDKFPVKISASLRSCKTSTVTVPENFNCDRT